MLENQDIQKGLNFFMSKYHVMQYDDFTVYTSPTCQLASARINSEVIRLLVAKLKRLLRKLTVSTISR